MAITDAPPPRWLDLPLTHYSARPVTAVYSVGQRPEPDVKPRGLWLSVDDGAWGWKDWCEAERWGVERLTHAHAVRLDRDARILHLSGAEDIDAFTRNYERRPGWGPSFRMIGWSAVARDYQGIVIAPYIYERRLCERTRWYYGWDCASGCIWDAGAVEMISLRAAEQGSAAA